MTEHLHFPTIESMKATMGTPDQPVYRCACGEWITTAEDGGRFTTVQGYPTRTA